MHTRGKGPIGGSAPSSSPSSTSQNPPSKYVDVRPTGPAASSTPSVPAAQQKKKEVSSPVGVPSCCICYDDIPDKASSVHCSSKAKGPRTSITHYCCKEDFESYVKSKLSSLQDFGNLMTTDRVAIACIDNSCDNSESTLMEFQEMVKKDVESRVIREQQAQLQKQLELERTQSEFTRKTNHLIKTIRDEILTLCCPHCQAAFVDFEGCFALNCSRCKGNFCAWCLSSQANSALCHQHVASCPEKSEKKRDVFFSKAVFEKHHQKRNLKRMNDLLAEGDNKNLLVAVKAQIEPQLTLHGFSMDATGKLTISKKAGVEAPGKKGRGAHVPPAPPAAAGGHRLGAFIPPAAPPHIRGLLDGLLMRLNNGQLFDDDDSGGDFSGDEDDFMPFGALDFRLDHAARQAMLRNEAEARRQRDNAERVALQQRLNADADRRLRDINQYRQNQQVVAGQRNAQFDRQLENRNRERERVIVEENRAAAMRFPPPQPFFPVAPPPVMQPIGKDELIDLVGPPLKGPAPAPRRLAKIMPGEVISVISDDEEDTVRPAKKARYPAATSSSSSSTRPVSVGAPPSAVRPPHRGATSSTSSSSAKGNKGSDEVIEIE